MNILEYVKNEIRQRIKRAEKTFNTVPSSAIGGLIQGYKNALEIIENAEMDSLNVREKMVPEERSIDVKDVLDNLVANVEKAHKNAVDYLLHTQGYLPPRNEDEMRAFERVFSKVNIPKDFHINTKLITDKDE